MGSKEFSIIDLEKAMLSIPDRIHNKIDGLKKYQRLSDKHKKLKTFLSGVYVCTAKWHNHNRKFNLDKKIELLGQEYGDQIKEIYDMIYDKDFLDSLKANSREIFQVLVKNYNEPDLYR